MTYKTKTSQIPHSLVEFCNILEQYKMDGFLHSLLGNDCYNQFFVKQNFFGWSYSFRKGFAFNTYGESAFMAVQDLVIITLIFMYNGGISLQFLLILILYSATTYLFLFNPLHLAPIEMIATLQQFTIPILIASRIPQILGNFRAKSTGQLALVTWLLNFVGSAARVFTTIQETQDTTLLASFLIAVLLNGIIFAQILVYSNAEDSNTQTAQGSTAAAPTSPKKVRPKRD